MAITLIVEDGTKPAGANTYSSIADADTYHATYGNEDWAGLDDDTKSEALVLATQAVDLLYGPKYQSYIYYSSNQSLLFPRAQFWDANYRLVSDKTIPSCLKNAIAEVALMQNNGFNIFPLEATTQNIKQGEVKVGTLLIKNEYAKQSAGETYDGFRKVDLLMAPILNTVNGNWRLNA